MSPVYAPPSCPSSRQPCRCRFAYGLSCSFPLFTNACSFRAPPPPSWSNLRRPFSSPHTLSAPSIENGCVDDDCGMDLPCLVECPANAAPSFPLPRPPASHGSRGVDVFPLTSHQQSSSSSTLTTSAPPPSFAHDCTTAPYIACHRRSNACSSVL